MAFSFSSLAVLLQNHVLATQRYAVRASVRALLSPLRFLESDFYLIPCTDFVMCGAERNYSF